MISKRIFGVVRFAAAVVPLLLCVTADANAQEPTVTVLHTFTNGTGEGINPDWIPDSSRRATVPFTE